MQITIINEQIYDRYELGHKFTLKRLQLEHTLKNKQIFLNISEQIVIPTVEISTQMN